MGLYLSADEQAQIEAEKNRKDSLIVPDSAQNDTSQPMSGADKAAALKSATDMMKSASSSSSGKEGAGAIGSSVLTGAGSGAMIGGVLGGVPTAGAGIAPGALIGAGVGAAAGLTVGLLQSAEATKERKRKAAADMYGQLVNIENNKEQRVQNAMQSMGNSIGQTLNNNRGVIL
jgi:hypothetical protein